MPIRACIFLSKRAARHFAPIAVRSTFSRAVGARPVIKAASAVSAARNACTGPGRKQTRAICPGQKGECLGVAKPAKRFSRQEQSAYPDANHHAQ